MHFNYCAPEGEEFQQRLLVQPTHSHHLTTPSRGRIRVGRDGAGQGSSGALLPAKVRLSLAVTCPKWTLNLLHDLEADYRTIMGSLLVFKA